MSEIIDITASESPRLYDRMKGETTKAWQAFIAYRDLGPERKMQDAYLAYTYGYVDDEIRTTKRKSTPDYWTKWRRVNQWDERVAAYDRDIELECRRAALSGMSQEYTAKLVAYQKQNEAIGIGVLNLAAKITVCLHRAVDPIAQKPKQSKEDLETLTKCAAALKTLAGAAEVGSKIAGDAYFLPDLLERVSRFERQHQLNNGDIQG